MFTENQRSTFKYWFAHWCAFQMTALNHGCWKPKYLLHDIEKPWLKLILKDYSKVQKIHRSRSNHHIANYVKQFLANKNVKYTFDWDAMIIDYECSKLTKASQQLSVEDTIEQEYCNLIENNYGVTEDLAFLNDAGEIQNMPYNYCAELYKETAFEHLNMFIQNMTPKD